MGHAAGIGKILFLGVLGDLAKVVEIHPRAEGGACAGKDHDVGGGFLHVMQRVMNLLDEPVADGIALLGTIERYGRDWTVICERESSVMVFVMRHRLLSIQ